MPIMPHSGASKNWRTSLCPLPPGMTSKLMRRNCSRAYAGARKLFLLYLHFQNPMEDGLQRGFRLLSRHARL